MLDPFLADFLARARTRLRPSPPAHATPGDEPIAFGDHAVSPGLESAAGSGPATPAAVLIAILARAEGATLLLTRRAAALRRHSGQIAFPGGRIDPGDAGPLAAALREANEEIGLVSSLVEPIGYLDLYLTTTGYAVAPVVGLLETPPALSLNPAEVDIAFECPLSFLMDPVNHRLEQREWRGAMRSSYAISCGEHYIWGVTAGILRMLHDQVFG